jgi:two-component system, OmpR family, alkaline phosphatase synthesis response regulator PhoP
LPKVFSDDILQMEDSMPQFRVAIVDDDEKLVKLLRAYFEKDGWSVLVASDGLKGLQLIRDSRPDLVVLDIMLPGIDGWELCRRLRQDNDVPVVMLTARDEETDRLIGLELGADDYVTKPFSPREVVARAKAIMRRAHRAVVKREPIRIGPLIVDTEMHEVRRDELLVELTPTEFKILELLAGQPGRPFTRLQIIEQVQGEVFEGYERTVDAHIKNLRHKLGDDGKEPVYIQTVYGIGYKMTGDKNA